MRLLLLSNSTSDDGYLVHAAGWLRAFLGNVERVLFIPYAGVTVTFDDYAAKVREAFGPLGVGVASVQEADDAAQAVADAEAVVVGGGNTFQLLARLHQLGLIEPIRRAVRGGTPYVGWSAGANLACPTIRTTNDMPIVEPPSFEALGLVPVQINPHYTDAHPPGHRGETRADRIAEFVEVNREATVLGMPEGTALRVEGERMERLGPHVLRRFRHGEAPRDLSDTDLSELFGAG